MSRRLSRQLTSLFVARTPRNRSRAQRQILEVLEPRTLLSTWYVDSSFGGTSTGTQAQPFKSIQAGVTASSSSDTILVENGVNYNESVSIPSGDSGLQILADTSQSPILLDSGGIAFTVNAANVEIKGFQIGNYGTAFDFASGGSGGVDGVTFKATLGSNTYYDGTDVKLESGAGSVNLGASAGNAFLGLGGGATYINNLSTRAIDATNTDNTYDGLTGDPAWPTTIPSRTASRTRSGTVPPRGWCGSWRAMCTSHRPAKPTPTDRSSEPSTRLPSTTRSTSREGHTRVRSPSTSRST